MSSQQKQNEESQQIEVSKTDPYQLQYQIVFRAETSITHSATTIGNHSVAQTRKMMQRDGDTVSVPIISADSMRHKMRDTLARIFLSVAGLIGAKALTASIVRLLFNGGMLTGVGEETKKGEVPRKSASSKKGGKGKKDVDAAATTDPDSVASIENAKKADGKKLRLDVMRSLRHLVPSLKLFGGCANAHMIPGQLQVENAVMICDETRHLWPKWVGEYLSDNGISITTFREYIENEQNFRADPMNDPAKRRLLTDEENEKQNNRLLSVDAAHVDDDAQTRDESKGTGMPRTCEALISGSLFTWIVTATIYDELDLDTFNTAVFGFLNSTNALVGGKGGTGHGRIEPLAVRCVKISHRDNEGPQATDIESVSRNAGDLFRKHIASNKAELMTVLQSVQA